MNKFKLLFLLFIRCDTNVTGAQNLNYKRYNPNFTSIKYR